MTYFQRAGYCTSNVLDSYYGAVQFESRSGNQLRFYVAFLETPPHKEHGSTSIKPRLFHPILEPRLFHPILFQVIFHEESQPLYGLRYRQRGTIHFKNTSCIQ
jgi:hypothetical protein